MNFKKLSVNHKTKEWMKVALYTGVVAAVYTTASYATFEAQIEKASSLTLGKLAGLILGGGAIVGGGLQVKDGNVMKGLGVIAVVGIIGLGVALIKAGTVFNVLQ